MSTKNITESGHASIRLTNVYCFYQQYTFSVKFLPPTTARVTMDFTRLWRFQMWKRHHKC